MGLVDKDGNEINDVNINISKRSADHQANREALNKGLNTTVFTSKEDMEAKADKLYGGAAKLRRQEKIDDKTLSFDIDDIESIRAFDIGYCPYGQTIIIKHLFIEEEIGNIIIPDSTSEGKKAVVVCTGLYAPNLRVGDVIILRPIDNGGKIYTTNRTFKGVKFAEVELGFVTGVFKSISEINSRVEEDFKRYNKLKGSVE